MEGAGFSLVGAPSLPQLHPCIIYILSKRQPNLDTTSTQPQLNLNYSFVSYEYYCANPTHPKTIIQELYTSSSIIISRQSYKGIS